MTDYTRDCKAIANELEDIASGKIYRCPCCGELIPLLDDYYDSEAKEYTCQICKQTSRRHHMVPRSIVGYIDDEAIDIEFRVGLHSAYRSARLQVTCSGPTIFVDTATKTVELYWFTDHASYPISGATAAEIDDACFELFQRSSRVPGYDC